MVELAHEIWEDPDGCSFAFGLPHPKKDAFRQEHEPNARLLHVIFASSYGAAMAAYYEWQGWEEYKPFGDHDEAYTADQLEEQRLLRPTLYR
ncbi:hypothetical protein [Phenylobacterium aquaticum]|uniref:hypothetical protein n=1 Tax=Phenylobacterium aquaticum TaxID=1763816 RepID=UPI0026EC5826|nr:hypothetical protein [Phenylobacterium aquaticum]